MGSACAESQLPTTGGPSPELMGVFPALALLCVPVCPMPSKALQTIIIFQGASQRSLSAWRACEYLVMRSQPQQSPTPSAPYPLGISCFQLTMPLRKLLLAGQPPVRGTLQSLRIRGREDREKRVMGGEEWEGGHSLSRVSGSTFEALRLRSSPGRRLGILPHALDCREVADNELTGTLPTSVGSLVNLQFL